MMLSIMVGVPFALLITWLLYEHLPRSREALFDKRFRELRDEMNQRKLTPGQMRQELTFRSAMARLRRRASASALSRPGLAREHLRELAADEASIISDRQVKRWFMEVAVTGPISDVLYPDAMKAVDAHDRTVLSSRLGRSRVTVDDIAAVTTQR